VNIKLEDGILRYFVEQNVWDVPVQEFPGYRLPGFAQAIVRLEALGLIVGTRNDEIGSHNEVIIVTLTKRGHHLLKSKQVVTSAPLL